MFFFLQKLNIFLFLDGSGGSLDDGRMESGGGGVSHSHGQQIGALGSYSTSAPRSNSSTSSSPPAASSASANMSVVVPQPISASKMAAPSLGASGGGGGGGGGRKYQCKMCPQVGSNHQSFTSHLISNRSIFSKKLVINSYEWFYFNQLFMVIVDLRNSVLIINMYSKFINIFNTICLYK